MEIIVNFDKIVRINYTKGWTGDVYKLCLTDGREHYLHLECGKKLWNDFQLKADKKYL